MFNLFVSIKPKIEKFTLLIEKVTFFQQNLDLIGMGVKISNERM